jgi:ADP-ribose pyrophosphatase
VESPDEILFQSRRFQVVRRRRALADGRELTHESVQHPGAVGILPILDGERVCLIRNYRMAVGQWLVEIPAGTLEPGEEPATTARRELREETGYECRDLRKLREVLVSPGILNERLHLFLATGLAAGQSDLQPDERIEKLIVPWSEALAMTADGRIQDVKTLVALLHYQRIR